jgi:hypothetical protein
VAECGHPPHQNHHGQTSQDLWLSIK